MNSTAWHNLDRGKLTVKQACKHFGTMLGTEPIVIEAALEEAHATLKVVRELVETITHLKALNGDLKFYVMSNISKEHLEIVKQKLDLPWSDFTQVFASGEGGVRKPELGFCRYVIDQIGVRPEQAIMVDDTVENICAARSLGIHGLLADSRCPEKTDAALRNLLQDPLLRADAYLKTNAGNHLCVIQGRDNTTFRDNFSQLMIWELTEDADIVCLRWPSNALNDNEKSRSVNGESGTKRGTDGMLVPAATKDAIRNNIEYGLWNYFCDEPILTTKAFPDADTTSMAYLSLPEAYLCQISAPESVFAEMAANIDSNGIIQTYFCANRPRTTPEVCCNVTRAFSRFGRGSDTCLKASKDWVVSCLKNGVCLYGNRHYSTPESFLYFVARLYDECEDSFFKAELEPVKEKLEERLNVPANPAALSLRLSAC